MRVKHWLNGNSQKLYDKGSVLRSVADLHRRAEVCRAACDRHLDALAAVKVKTPLAEEAAAVSRAVRKDGRRHRALNPLAGVNARPFLKPVCIRGFLTASSHSNCPMRMKHIPVASSKD